MKEKEYRNSDGEVCTLYQMVVHEPMWAANRIRKGEKALDKLRAIASAVHVERVEAGK